MPQPLFIGGKRILSFEKWVNSSKEHPCIVWLGKIGVGMFAVLLLANLVPVGKRIIKKFKYGKRSDWDA